MNSQRSPDVRGRTVGAFAALLAVVFAAAAFAGSRIDPDISASGSSNGKEMMSSHVAAVTLKQPGAISRKAASPETAENGLSSKYEAPREELSATIRSRSG